MNPTKAYYAVCIACCPMRRNRKTKTTYIGRETETMATIHIYYRNSDGKQQDIKYTDVTSIKAGSAAQVLGAAECRGNGIRPTASLIRLYMADGSAATFDADNVTILF